MTRKRLGALALLAGTIVIFALPAGSFGALDLRQVTGQLKQAGDQAQSDVGATVQKARDRTKAAVDRTKSAVSAKSQATRAKTRAVATDPAHQPALHGTNPHGQGGVGTVDIAPSNQLPLDGNPNGSGSGEDAIVGRSRGEQNADGTFHGHITVAALFGNEIVGVDSKTGETKHGPLQPVQTGVLDPICQSTNQQICLSVLKSDSTTTATGSTNDFAVASAGLLGLKVGAAESHGNISQDANCQTSVGTAKTANVATSSGTVAGVANSSSASKSCRGQAPQVANSSQVINLGGTGVGLPAPGCANGTPDTDSGLPGLLPIICNAEEIAGAAAVRDALDVFALQVGTNSLLKEQTASSESISVAPAEAGAQCNDGVDNDGDGVIDSNDPGCHSDGNANNASSFNPNDDSEGGGASTTSAGSLPFTGTDVIGLALAGLLALAGGLMLRRREDVRTVR